MRVFALYTFDMITITIIALVCLLVAVWLMKFLWDSWIFWAVTLAVSVFLFPVTAGMSVAGMLALVLARLFILRMLITK